MPIAFTVAESFTRPPEEVFAALVDLDAWPEWVPGLIRVAPLTPGPVGRGTRWRETRLVMKREGTEEFEVMVFDPPRRLELRVDGSRGSSKRGEYLFEYHLAPSPRGTEVVLHGEIRLGNTLLELAGRILLIAMRRAIAKDLAALAAHLETRQPSPSEDA